MRKFLLLLALAAVACDRGAVAGESVAPFATRDSAGITIAENPKNPAPGAPTWVVDSLPSAVVGGADTAAQFERIGQIALLPGGLIGVLDGRGESAFDFRFFDSTGRHVATHGRNGDGPGEFRWVSYFGPAGGDTIIAVDFVNKRLTWFTVSRGYARSIRLDEAQFKQLLGADAMGTSEMLVPLDDSVYAITAYRRRDQAGTSIGTNTYHIVDLRTHRVIDLASFEEPRGVPMTIAGERTAVFPIEPGQPVHVVDRARKRLCAAFTSVTEIRCVDSQGRRTFIRWHIDPVAFVMADRDATEQRLRATLKQYRRYSDRDADTYIRAIPWPTHWTAFSVLQIDADGNFWILEKALTATGERTARFRILGPDGKHVAFADAFPAQNVGLNRGTFIGTNAVLRLVESADGAPLVLSFPLRKGG